MRALLVFCGVLANSEKLIAIDKRRRQATRRFTIMSAVLNSFGLEARDSSSASARARDSSIKRLSGSLKVTISLWRPRQYVIASMKPICVGKGRARKGLLKIDCKRRSLTGRISSCTSQPRTSFKVVKQRRAVSRTCLFMCASSKTKKPDSAYKRLFSFFKSSFGMSLPHRCSIKVIVSCDWSLVAAGRSAGVSLITYIKARQNSTCRSYSHVSPKSSLVESRLIPRLPPALVNHSSL